MKKVHKIGVIAVAASLLAGGGAVVSSGPVFAAPTHPQVKTAAYSTRDILLGLLGQGRVAAAHPAVIVVQRSATDTAWVDGFLAFAEKTEPGFSTRFHTEITSGDPYQVKSALLDFTGVAQKIVHVSKQDRGTGSTATDFDIVAQTEVVTVFAAAAVVVLAAAAVVIPVAVLLVAPQAHGGLTADQYVASVAQALAA